MDRKGNGICNAHPFPTVEIDDTGILEFLGRDPPVRAGAHPLIITVEHVEYEA